jgi:hypothetical protein
MTSKTCELLHGQVALFKQWASAKPAGSFSSEYGEWECDYPDWHSLWAAAASVIQSVPSHLWTDDCSDDLLYAIARDNETEYIAEQLSGKGEGLLKLARLSVGSSEPEAKWQLAVLLGQLSSDKTSAEALLLILVNDEDEYVSRRALLALGALKSLHAESLAEKAWLSGHEYQRIAALWVLKDIASSKLAEYVLLAGEDGRKYLVNNAREIQRNL